MEIKKRYSDEELQEFKKLILEKMEIAKRDYEMLKDGISNTSSNGIDDTSPTFKVGIDDTSPTFKVLEEGAATLSKEEVGLLAQRMAKFISHLESALVRIENKTYGICRVTGKLIAKERLRLVPHATLSMEAKMQQK